MHAAPLPQALFTKHRGTLSEPDPLISIDDAPIRFKSLRRTRRSSPRRRSSRLSPPSTTAQSCGAPRSWSLCPSIASASRTKRSPTSPGACTLSLCGRSSRFAGGRPQGVFLAFSAHTRISIPAAPRDRPSRIAQRTAVRGHRLGIHPALRCQRLPHPSWARGPRALRQRCPK